MDASNEMESAMKDQLRTEIVNTLKAKVLKGEPIIAGGAGIGLVAKVIARAGIDLIMAYNTGPFRMDGHGSLAGYLAYGDSNQMTIDMAGKIIPVAGDTPVIAGIGAADPYRDPKRLIGTMIELGYSGITNVPTAGLYDGNFRRQIDETNLGYPREIELIKECNKQDVFTLAYAFNIEEVKAMADAGADVIGAHVGLTVGGLIGSQTSVDIQKACQMTQEMIEAAKAVNPEVLVVAHGGPFDDAKSVDVAFQNTDADGFLGASSIERLPVEEALTHLITDLRSLRLKRR